jgi:transcriptional regulator with XRE-family HTH domain/Zn-dependent peptidase ImmA (M78 family)
MNNNMKSWDNPSYQKIQDAKFANNNVVVDFENGDVIKVPKENLIPYGYTDIEWNKLRFTPYEIIIPANPNTLEIPWDNLRVITDKDFGKYLADKSEEQSKLIGKKVKRLREKKGIKSNELAERSGVTPQTISRIEKGHTDVSFATLRKILASMGYSLQDLANQETELEFENEFKSMNLLKKKLSFAGIDSSLLTQKIIPKNIQVNLNSNELIQPSLLLDEVAAYISTIYGWTLDEIWSNKNLVIETKPAKIAYFKKPTNANLNQVTAYSHYAYYLAKVVLKASNINKNEYPESIEDFKAQYLKESKDINLEALLNFVWQLGICVLPLSDSGVFHGASWNINGKHIIVLKQNTKSHARWIFDLLHELYHVFVHLDEENTSVVEVEELKAFSNNDSIEELEANSFANQFIFGMRAEELAERCAKLANWDIKNLKKAVEQVASEENIRVDFLSNYLACRLSYQGENWWGSANKMQIIEPDPFIITSNFLKNKIQIEKLNPIDFNLLNTAITN